MIEVMIVLAIVALIFIFLFLGVPALQRNGRNTRRRSDLGKFFSAVIEYQHSRGRNTQAPFFKKPDHISDFDYFKDNYLGSEFEVYNGKIDFADAAYQSHTWEPPEDHI